MNPLRKTLAHNPVLKLFASIKITVVCFGLLFILTFWGTIAQVDQGLYIAQERFFNSWTFLVFDFLPLPGAQLVLWVLFINLLSNALIRFVYRWSHIGITITHIGLLLYFVSAFVTFNVTEESNVTLKEGETKNVSLAYFHWEISIWPEQKKDVIEVTAIDSDDFSPGETIHFPNLNVDLRVQDYYLNSEAYTAKPTVETKDYVNASGIQYIKKIQLKTEPEQNFPGGLFTLKTKESDVDILLYGGEVQPTPFVIDSKAYNIQLRRKRFALPFKITLNNFEKEMHPGTEMARAFRSFVVFEHEGVKRDAKIYMNHPLRFKDYTLYQASYAINQNGEELSTLAVVKNAGRLLPYISCFVVLAGLLIHYLLMAFGKFKVR